MTDISEPDKNEFYALVFDFEKISFKPKYQSSFNVLRKREWTLDWKYVNFRNGYFVVSPPENGIIKFNPLAVSYPGVLESFNYLKDYLNDRLYPVRCFVEEMKLTIYDRIRLDEAIVKFTKASKQRLQDCALCRETGTYDGGYYRVCFSLFYPMWE